MFYEIIIFIKKEKVIVNHNFTDNFEAFQKNLKKFNISKEFLYIYI